jgi:predicted Zn-dependent peptidase
MTAHLRDPDNLRELEPFSRACPQDALSVTRRAINQTQLAFGWRAFGLMDTARLPVLSLLSCALGETMMSRLFQNIRERKGYCYSIHSGSMLCIDTGALLITAGCEAAKSAKCTKAILAEVRKMMEKPMSAAELRRTRDYLCGRFRLRMDNAPINWLAGRVLFDLPYDPQATLESFRSVSAQDIQQLAAEILTPERLSLAVVAPESLKRSDEAWAKLMTY